LGETECVKKAGQISEAKIMGPLHLEELDTDFTLQEPQKRVKGTNNKTLDTDGK
jgi:hypothetical protein